MQVFKIERLGHQGDGIAPGPVFAPMTLPDEEVSGSLDGDRLADIRVLTPSPERVSPPCRHFKSCGGCQLQHASDALVAEWKVEMVKQALDAHGLSTHFRPIITSPAQSRRRAVFSARRNRKSALAGFHARASNQVIATPNCKLVDRALLAGLRVSERLAELCASRRNELNVTVTLSDGGLDVSAAGGPDADRSKLVEMAGLAERFDLARLTWNNEIIVTRRPPIHSFAGIEIVPPPSAFLQATKEGETALRDAVQEVVSGAKSIIDLFAGCGTFALPLAAQARVHAVEASHDMVQTLNKGWRNGNDLRQVTSETRDLFRNPVRADELSYLDACVIDPPRAGARAQVHELARASIARIAYVSCNPRTFARDAAALIDAGYELDWVQVVDQFRWSTHVELASSFTLTSA
ncbi:class I SAM-dependent RNA methyltransferase [Aquicoccus sp.]|uniref:class I SAM-dependent RNA methyltransferase n=1 Tax=Aquicoccus sp. TaxID=2055851 RepID=UPI0035654449